MEIQSVVGKKDTFCLFLVCWWFCRNSGKGNNVVLKSVKNSIYWVWNVSKEREGKGEGAWSSIAVALTVPLLSSGVMDEREKLVFYWVIFYWDLNQKNVFSYRNLSILGERFLLWIWTILKVIHHLIMLEENFMSAWLDKDYEWPRISSLNCESFNIS